jgi:hypothetical protein
MGMAKLLNEATCLASERFNAIVKNCGYDSKNLVLNNHLIFFIANLHSARLMGELEKNGVIGHPVQIPISGSKEFYYSFQECDLDRLEPEIKQFLTQMKTNHQSNKKFATKLLNQQESTKLKEKKSKTDDKKRKPSPVGTNEPNINNNNAAHNSSNNSINSDVNHTDKKLRYDSADDFAYQNEEIFSMSNDDLHGVIHHHSSNNNHVNMTNNNADINVNVYLNIDEDGHVIFDATNNDVNRNNNTYQTHTHSNNHQTQQMVNTQPVTPVASAVVSSNNNSNPNDDNDFWKDLDLDLLMPKTDSSATGMLLGNSPNYPYANRLTSMNPDEDDNYLNSSTMYNSFF